MYVICLVLDKCIMLTYPGQRLQRREQVKEEDTLRRPGELYNRGRYRRRRSHRCSRRRKDRVGDPARDPVAIPSDHRFRHLPADARR